MLKRLGAVLIAAALSGCATSYGSHGLSGGYEVVHLEGDIYRVNFAGNGFTNRETVQTFWYHRASELAIEKGFTGFQILNLTVLGQSRISYESDIRLVKGNYPHTPPVYFDAKVVNAATAPYLSKDKQCDAYGNVCPHLKRFLQPVKPATPPNPKVAVPQRQA